MRNPEPWLRGPIEGVHPLVMPVFFSFAQVREDLRLHLSGFSDEEVWRACGGTSLGFQLKHMAGSVDRLTTYLRGGQLSAGQLSNLHAEHLQDTTLAELLKRVDSTLASAEEYLKTVDPHALYEAREVGRQALPTTVIGLLVHLAEHTQRHLGQAITLSKVIRQSP